MKIYGTQIDGPVFNPEGLQVRGLDLNDLIANYTFAEALFHLFASRMPSSSEALQLNSAMTACCRLWLQDMGPQAEPVPTMYSPVRAMLMGLCQPELAMVELPQGSWPEALCADPATPAGLTYLSILPLYAARAVKRPLALPHSASYVFFLSDLFFGSVGGGHTRLLNALLIAWHGGFGYLTPSVHAPRIAAATGATAAMILGAGICASGPKHIGASADAFRLLQQLDRLPEQSIEADISRRLEQREAIPGFGHPLFRRDPRVQVLRVLWETEVPQSYWRSIYDTVVRVLFKQKEIHPNIDFITAALTLEMGAGHAEIPMALGLFARGVAMLVHAEEQRTEPPFGGRPAEFREQLAGKNHNGNDF